MAISVEHPFTDSINAPVRDWSCPLHSWPWDDEDDDRDDVGCLGCRYGKWVDRLDENGDPVLGPVYTLIDMAALLADTYAPTWLDDAGVFPKTVTLAWNEDSLSHGD